MPAAARKSFRELLGVPQKTDHSVAASGAKLQIRQNVFDEIPAPRRVFDAFAGAGQFYRDIWSRAEAGYIGCDELSR